ncbi:MAG: ABC transporter ATP-binding protein, partial [Oscillospiraceae bacterium]
LFKVKLADILKKLCTSGVTIVMVSHDVEFCAEYSDMCSMLFNGEIITTAPPKEFFGGNSFYTTAANKMSRHLFQNAVTNEEVIALCMQSPTEQA